MSLLIGISYKKLIGGVVAAGGLVLKAPLGDHMLEKNEKLMKEWNFEEKKEKLRIY